MATAFLLSDHHDQSLAPGDPGVEQITLQHGVVLRHDRNYHSRVFRALALVDGCGVSRQQGVEFAEAISDKPLIEGRGKLAVIGLDSLHVADVDTLPSEPAYRGGTPQARHVHALLLSGQPALIELFPGFEQNLMRHGAVPLRAGLDVRIERPGYDPFPQRDLGWSSYAVSRRRLSAPCDGGWKLLAKLSRLHGADRQDFPVNTMK